MAYLAYSLRFSTFKPPTHPNNNLRTVHELRSTGYDPDVCIAMTGYSYIYTAIHVAGLVILASHMIQLFFYLG